MEISKQVKPRVKKGLWKPDEDLILKQYVETHGEGNWTTVSERSGLMRGGKSCRLRWKNYLRPNIKRGGMSEEEQDLIIRMHKLLGNRWSLIAGRLPGRTDNEVKNYWNTHLNKKYCPQAKRKAIDSNNNYNNYNDNDKKKKLRRRLCNSETIRSLSPIRNTTGVLYGGKEEESNVTRPWTEDTHNFNYDIESPLVPATGATFIFDDEPFKAYLHSFFLFEEECNAEETYSQVGKQTLVP